jgi:molecular chaperone IbpA
MTSLIRSNLLPTNIFDGLFGTSDIFSEYKTSIPYNVARIVDDKGEVTATKLEVALAGYDKEDIQVKVTNTDLQILVNKSGTEDEQVKYIHKGIAQRSTHLKFKLVNGYDVKKIKSRFKNGLLTVEVPVNVPDTVDIQVD